MKVSIITPSFNQGQFIEETIQSVLSQSYPNIEYIVIDGGSSDNSIQIINKYSHKIAYWVSEPDNGQADAINKGFSKATGDLICWVNSDDILYPNFITERVIQFNENPLVDFIYGDVDQGVEISRKILRKGELTDFKTMLLTLYVPVPQQSSIWRRSVIEKLGYLDPKWRVLLDWEYFMRISLNCNMLYKPGVVAFFRNHVASKSVAEWRKWAEELEIYYYGLFSGVLTSEYLPLKASAIAAMYYKCATICEDCKDLDAKKKYLSLARELKPFFVLKKDAIGFLKNVYHRLTKMQALTKDNH